MAVGPWQILLFLFVLAIPVAFVGVVVAVVYFVLKSQKPQTPQTPQDGQKSIVQEIKS
jgi:mannose/fructose/N-acetylgalactosamine-specific phosphotransferase system component IIC